MQRTAIALVAGLLGVALYVGVVVAAGDHILGTHWLLELLFFTVAGLVWVVPVWALMRWAARPR